MLKEAWKIADDPSECFPEDIATWIKYHSTMLGVPKSYLSVPLLVSTAYCAQHTTVSFEDMHTQPVILYDLVAGRSGTNKSGSLKSILDVI